MMRTGILYLKRKARGDDWQVSWNKCEWVDFPHEGFGAGAAMDEARIVFLSSLVVLVGDPGGKQKVS